MADPTPDVAAAVQNHAGWVVAGAAGLWGWFLRTILGRHLKGLDEMRVTLKGIDKRLSRIEGRFIQQDADAVGGE